MRRVILFFLFIILAVNISAQDFFRQDFNRKKTYVLLANPTESNIITLNYLIKNHILKINTSKIKFVGIYHEGQKYNFNKTLNYIKKQNLKNFYLHEFRGQLDIKDLFVKNNLSHEIQKIYEYSAGIFFFGGPDIPPEVYGQNNTMSKVTDPMRHFFELTFLFHLIGGYQDESFMPLLQNKPLYFITGFCLGLQTMNVAAGGSLIQDIPAEIFGAKTPDAIVKAGRNNLHKNYWPELSDDTLLTTCNIHPIRFTDHPFFGRKVKVPVQLRPLVYSSHHQAIKETGKDLVITALSIDEKIIEAIAHNRYPNVFSVQFHPEIPALYEKMQQIKYHPDDTPCTHNEYIGKESLNFHKKYWRFISKALRKAARSGRSVPNNY
jgi:putative glutamine amidotransferase